MMRRSDSKSCFTCKFFSVIMLYKDGGKAFRTSLDKCGWEYMYYKVTKEKMEFFNNIYCNNYEKEVLE